MADQLTTIAKVKTQLKITDTNDDTFLTYLVESVSGWVEMFTGRKFVAEAGATYVFDTRAGYVLRIPRGIRTITSMGVATTPQPDTGGTYTAVPAADRLLRPKAAELTPGWPFLEVRLSRGTLSGTIASFATVENGCTITGDFGFAATPPEVEACVIDACAAAYSVRKQGASGVIGADDTALPPWRDYFWKGSPQRATLEHYREYAV